MNRGGPDAPPPTLFEIVGVVGDARNSGLQQEPNPQAFLPYIRDLLTPQVYTYRTAPYDIAGWTLPIQMGVRVEKVEEVQGTFEPVTIAPVPARPARSCFPR